MSSPLRFIYCFHKRDRPQRVHYEVGSLMAYQTPLHKSGLWELKINLALRPPLRVPTHIEKNKKVYFFIKRLRHTDAHFSLLLSA